MNQTEKVYLISDAAKKVQVEAHVLRYWEEELALPIRRNEMGHRFYTGEDIERFIEIRELKSRGLQLKAIRTLLMKTDMGAGGYVRQEEPEAGRETYAAERKERHVVMVNKGEFLPVPEESREAKSARLQQLLQHMITEAVKSTNREVLTEIKESLIKELDYQFRIQEERQDVREEERISRQEEHYRQIDDLLRVRTKRQNLRQIRASETKERGLEETLPLAEEKNVCRDESGEQKQMPGEDLPGGKKKFGILRKKRSIV